jgi:hypothetical protein
MKEAVMGKKHFQQIEESWLDFNGRNSMMEGMIEDGHVCNTDVAWKV